MKKTDSKQPKLTENDKKVLKIIIDSKKIPDSDIAKTLNISPQAVFKIRAKLEQTGIIRGYVPIIDYKKIGINLISVIVIRLTSKTWNKFTDEQLSEKIKETPHIISAYRVVDERASHILIMGFRDTLQKEKYITQIQVKHSDLIEINAIYTFSADKIICQSSLGLLHEVIDKTKNHTPDIFSTLSQI